MTTPTTTKDQELEEICVEYFRQNLHIEYLNHERETAIKLAIPKEIQETIDTIDATYDQKIKDEMEKIKQTENNIKNAVLERKETFKINGVTAVYNKGRVSWDDKFLKGVAVKMPVILKGRSEGKPYVSLKITKLEQPC
jgi:hypothetical protein